MLAEVIDYIVVQSMATDMRRLNMALEDEAQGSCKVASSPSVCSMQTDRDDSIGCASPAISECFNPFESSSVHSKESPRPPLGGNCCSPSSIPAHQDR